MKEPRGLATRRGQLDGPEHDRHDVGAYRGGSAGGSARATSTCKRAPVMKATARHTKPATAAR